MDLREYIKIIKSEQKLIIIIVLLTLLTTLLVSIIQKPYYEASVSLFINKNGTQNTDEFKYDGYYALESGEIITENIEKMLQSPQIVNEIYRDANVNRNFKNIKNYKKSFTAHKMSNQYVEVSFRAGNKEEAKNIAQSITKIAQNKIEELNRSSEEEISFLLEETEPIIIEKRFDIILNSIVGIISGFFLGIMAVLTKRYFEQK